MTQHIPGSHQYSSVTLSGSAYAHFGDVVLFADPTGHEAQDECHRSFKTSNYEQHKSVIARRAPNTCHWAVEHRQFKRWYTSPRDNLLWISADPGCGKSVLARYLIDEWLPQQLQGSTVCYYFFQNNDEQASLSLALSAMLHQLFAARRWLIETHAIPAWRKTGDRLAQEVPSLWRILLSAASDSNHVMGPVVCVIDALDECLDTDTRDLITRLCQFQTETSSASDGSRPRLKFLVTSRPYDTVQRWFTETTRRFTWMRLRGEDENDSINAEINRVVHEQIQSLADEFDLSPATYQNLLGHLLNMQHRTYLWLHLALQHIRDTLYNSVYPDSVQIQNLPSSVEEAYEVILNRIPPTQTPKVMMILQLVVGSRRVLSVEELAVALSVQNHAVSSHDFQLINPNHLESRIRQWCGLFIFVNHSYVYLIHQTAKEFLLADGGVSTSDRWKGCLSVDQCELLLAQVTMKYLSLDRVQVSVLPGLFQFIREAGVEESKTFFIYAADHWASHLRATDIQSSLHLLEMASTLCTVDRGLPSWFRFKHGPIFVSPGGHLQPGDILPQHIAALVGHVPLLDLLYERQSFNMDTVDNQNRTALILAIFSGYEDAVDWFLQKGARVDAGEEVSREICVSLALENRFEALVERFTNLGLVHRDRSEMVMPALHIAVSHGQTSIAKMLLKNSASVAHTDTLGQTALHVAVAGGMSEMTELLLENGTPIDHQGMCGETALYLAVSKNEPEIAQRLLDHGANTDLSNYDGQTPLSYASRWGSISVVQQILLNGANPNIQACRGHADSALHEAVVRADLEIVRMLLQNGADINMRSGLLGDTALTLASRRGPKSLVQLLLRNGADPNIKRIPGDRALDIAIYVSQGQPTPIVGMLLLKGARPSTLEGHIAVSSLMERYHQRSQSVTASHTTPT